MLHDALFSLLAGYHHSVNLISQTGQGSQSRYPYPFPRHHITRASHVCGTPPEPAGGEGKTTEDHTTFTSPGFIFPKSILQRNPPPSIIEWRLPALSLDLKSKEGYGLDPNSNPSLTLISP
ncbi:hypothetical protein ZOSMA_5G00180 [Zostera marina]|uniref:Uncharacterized protein n=1 Tax=Zostera marina TaxID=29655 RepID=A0A0K9NVS7_ZOSMR|nr:hypothetical protein ZOSMA_5G00180 [Zostera marina]